MIPLKSQAIQTALMGDWNTAIQINQELLEENPNDLETLNRLAFALTVVGKIKDAKKIYRKVLDIDEQNPIALKNLKRLTNSNKKTFYNSQFILPNQINTMFIEETGKTKVIELVNLATPKIITNLMTGEILTLCIKRLKIFVLDGKKQYIGMFPEDIGKRLIKFIKGGNVYEACVKAIKDHHVVIFIKEIKRVPRFKNQPSFISTTDKKAMLTNKNYLQNNDDKNSQKYTEKETDES